jgi:hypothetical protein
MSSKINIPTITKPIDLAEYDPALRREDGSPAQIDVWVNPTREHQAKRTEIGVRASIGAMRLEQLRTETGIAPEEYKTRIEAISQESDAIMRDLMEWHTVTWSKNGETWNADEVGALADRDPALWGWLADETRRLIDEFRESRRKK